MCLRPQGSVLGPLLLILYINDLQFASNILNPILYADDSNLSISGRDIMNTCAILHNELNQVNQWFSTNELKLIPQSHLHYGGRTVAVELQNRVIPAVAVEILRWPRIPVFNRSAEVAVEL